MVLYTLLIIGILVSVFLRLKLNFSNPLVLFIGTWGLMFLIYFQNIFPNFFRLSLKSIFILGCFIFITMCSFILGNGIQKKPKHANEVHYDEKRMIMSFNILTFIVVCVFILTWFKLGAPPMLSGSIKRSDYYLPGLEFLYLTIYLAFFIGLFLVKNYHVFKKIILQLTILLTVMCLRGNKTAIFLALLMVLFFFGKHISIPKIVLLSISIIFIFYLASFMYLRTVDNSNLLKYSKIAMTGYSLQSLYILYDPLIYLVSNLYNFNGLVLNNLSGIGFGSKSFPGIIQIIAIFYPKIGFFKDNLQLSMTSTLQFPTLNTFSGLGNLYVDFGEVISIVIFALLSFVSGVFFRNRENNKSVVIDFIDFIIYATIGLSFFTFYLGNKEVITNIIFIIIVHLYSRRKNE